MTMKSSTPARPDSVLMGPDHAFDALVQEYYRAWFRFHPEEAVEAGVDGYADRLTPYDDDDIGAQIALQEKLLAELDGIDAGRLDGERQVDFALLLGQAQLEHHRLLSRDWRRRDPERFLPLNALHQLTLYPVAGFDRAFRRRCEQIPAYLLGARAQLMAMPELIPPMWLESAVAAIEPGVAFIRGLNGHPRVRQAATGNNGLHASLEQAAEAVAEFGRFLETEIRPRTAGDFAIGREAFDQLLHERHFLPVDADGLHALGVRLFEQTRQALEDEVRTLRGDTDIQAMFAGLHADHPTADGLLAAYREQMQRAHAFVASHDLVSLPVPERLDVVATPAFLRHQIPFAAYVAPVPDDPEQHGYYYVTPAEDEAALGEHNWSALMHTCVHEAWPGHHLQFVKANQRPSASTLPRRVNASATLYEGWALYCEQLMHEQGFLDQPEQRFILLRDRLWRALRIQLDVELHTRGLSVEAAAERMQTSLGFTREQALADLNWYSRSPTVPMGYATGWRMMTEARDLALEQGMSLKAFHDRVLAGGSIALSLVLKQSFGEAFWETVSERVFG